MDVNEEFLEHHGILGMKWGIRRYQNKDGTLTAAGKKRVAKLESEHDKLTGKKNEDSSNSNFGSSKKKTIRDLSDDELRTEINRMQLERNYLDLNRQISSMTPQKVSKGKQFVSDLGTKVITPSIMDAGKNLLTKFLNKKGSELLGLDEKETKDAFKELQDEVREMNLKKQKNELNKYFDDLKKEQSKKEEKETNKTEKKSEEKSEEKETNKTEKNSEDKSEKTETFTPGPEDIFDGPSNKNSNNYSGSTSKGYTYWTENYTDISNMSYSSRKNEEYARIGSNYVAGLLEAPKKR